MHNPLRALAVLLFASSLAYPATGLTIDNFEEGDFSVTDTTIPAGTTFGEVSGLAGANTVGGVRLVRALAAGGVSGTAALVTTGADDGAAISVAGPPLNLGLADFAFIYDGVAGGLTNSGSAGTLGLDFSLVSSVEVAMSAPAVVGFMRLTLWTSTDNASTGFQAILNGNNSLLIDGNLLALDLTDIQAILIAVTDLNIGEAPTVFDISTATVPEPGTALLMAVGLVGLAIRRVRSR